MDLTNRWLIALYGWVLYNVMIFFAEKQIADAKSEKFHGWKFLEQHWDNWLVTLLFVPAIVLNGPDIHNFTMSIVNRFFDFKLPWYDIFYAGVGPFVEGLYFIGTKLVPLAKLKAVEWFKDKFGKKDNTPPPPPEQ